ncbi:hypothetical protein [Chryseobacterium sp.]
MNDLRMVSFSELMIYFYLSKTSEDMSGGKEIQQRSLYLLRMSGIF